MTLMKDSLGCFGAYSNFLETFLNSGYTFVGFGNFLKDKSHQVILRHDIDYDLECAYKAALVEHRLGIKSTYFFLLRSGFYNLFEERAYSLVLEIQNLGHEVSLHFDPLLYEDAILGLDFEKKVFKEMFFIDVKIISIHRPSEFYLNHDGDINGVEHTYQSKFAKNLKYFSDSTGIWRFGNPLDSREYMNRESMQLLIHPVWWFTKGNSNLDVLKQIYSEIVNFIKEDFLKNNNLLSLIYEQI